MSENLPQCSKRCVARLNALGQLWPNPTFQEKIRAQQWDTKRTPSHLSHCWARLYVCGIFFSPNYFNMRCHYILGLGILNLLYYFVKSIWRRYVSLCYRSIIKDADSNVVEMLMFNFSIKNVFAYRRKLHSFPAWCLNSEVTYILKRLTFIPPRFIRKINYVAMLTQKVPVIAFKEFIANTNVKIRFPSWISGQWLGKALRSPAVTMLFKYLYFCQLV